LALTFLAIINFFNVWLIVGFFSFLTLLYLLSRDTIFKSVDSSKVKNSSLIIFITSLICVVSVVFIVAGDYAGASLSKLTNLNYIEVRPSHSSTVGIAKSVYSENILLGVGPNKFADAWRQHKNVNINQTIFWDTEFNSGSSYISTLFVNLGILGGVFIVLFSLSFIYLGYKMLLRSGQNDLYWYYLGAVSFSVAIFIWTMTYVYSPGSAVLLIGAWFTGLTFVAAGNLLPEMVKKITLAANRRLGFLLMAIIIITITSSVTIIYGVSKQYIAQTNFSKTQATASSLENFSQETLKAFDLYQDDHFVNTLAQINIADINAMLSIENPTEMEQQLFLDTSQQALLLANQAVQLDPTNPYNHAVLAGAFHALAVAGIEGAQERALAALTEAQKLDPLNPGYHLIAAQMAFRSNNLSLAREEIFTALNLKRNFTQALYLLTQLEIAEGNTDSAISTTQAIITLEPNSPSRYLQLGLLYYAKEDYQSAIRAFTSAIDLDPLYANARYLQAVAYIETDQRSLALEQLVLVKETNPDNLLLDNLIEQIQSGSEVSIPDFGLSIPVNEQAPQVDAENTVTTEGDVDTDLITPVNTVSDSVSTNEVEADITPENSSEVNETEAQVVE
jgi:tetratricopeptide (TPR) repeat protein